MELKIQKRSQKKIKKDQFLRDKVHKEIRESYKNLMRQEFQEKVSNALYVTWFLKMQICFYIIQTRLIKTLISQIIFKKCNLNKKKSKKKQQNVQNVSKDSKSRSYLSTWSRNISCEGINFSIGLIIDFKVVIELQFPKVDIYHSLGLMSLLFFEKSNQGVSMYASIDSKQLFIDVLVLNLKISH